MAKITPKGNIERIEKQSTEVDKGWKRTHLDQRLEAWLAAIMEMPDEKPLWRKIKQLKDVSLGIVFQTNIDALTKIFHTQKLH